MTAGLKAMLTAWSLGSKLVQSLVNWKAVMMESCSELNLVDW